MAGFTLNPDKMTKEASDVKKLGHLLSSCGIMVFLERVGTIKEYSRPTILMTLR